MIKVFITDDEQIVIDGIRFIMEKDLSNTVEVVGTARSGGEALDKCMNISPDLFFMDIQMLGISGLDTIEYLKRQHRNAKFILITAYEEFSYAKRAIELGVKHYIIKPINRNHLYKVTKEVIQEIESEKQVIQENQTTVTMLKKILPSLDENVVYALMTNGDCTNELRRYQEIYQTTIRIGYIGIIEIGKDMKLFDARKIGYQDTLHAKISTLLRRRFHCIVGPIIANRIVFFVGFTKSESHDKLKRIEEFSKEINQMYQLFAKVTVGKNKSINDLYVSYQEALQQLSIIDYGEISVEKTQLDDLKNENEGSWTQGSTVLDQLLSAVEEGATKNIQLLVMSYFDQVKKLEHKEKNDRLSELMLLAYGKAYTYQAQNGLMPFDYVKTIVDSKSQMELSTWTVDTLTTISEKILKARVKQRSKLLQIAEGYIRENYNTQITLSEVAKLVSISPQYFAKLFKDSFGMTYVDYLTEIRLTKAKLMLLQTTLSIKEICYEVGYNDPNYFSRLFKKTFGENPSDFKIVSRGDTDV